MNAGSTDWDFGRVARGAWLVVCLIACPSAGRAAEYRLLWGDVHTHSNLSDGKGTPDQLLKSARDAAHLDFVILSDHDFGNGPPWRMSQEVWNQIQDKVDLYTVEGRFVAIAGYEWTSQAQYWTDVGPKQHSERLFPGPPKLYNHKNVYFPARVEHLFSAKAPAYHTPDLLAEAVRKHGGLIQNNHPFVFGNETRDQWQYDRRYGDVIANTEMGPDTNRYKGKTYQLNWEQAVRDFLDKGGKTGFVAGTDTHEGKPTARTAVLATALSREAIFEALRNRRNYAVTHARIALDFRINGHHMGEEIITQDQPQIAVSVTGTAPVAEVAIIRDGSVLKRLNPNQCQVKFSYRDDSFQQSSYYYLRVLQSDADEHGNPSRAWSSPIWVTRRRAPVQADQGAAADAGVKALNGYITALPPESPEDRLARHKKIAQRRRGPMVIVHRGAWALAPENTLEAYAAAMDYGADGCEIDIRRTADGVLVMLHDGGLDRMTDALGRINQYTYAELLGLKFRSIYGAKPATRIPTLAAVLELARQRTMLLHLDVKEPGLEEDIARLLDAADMWDQIVEINVWNATALRKNPQAHRLAYKAFGWQEGRMDMNPAKVREGLAKPGNMIMVDDPRVAVGELKRKTLRVPLPGNLHAPWPPGAVSTGSSRREASFLSVPAYLRSLGRQVDRHSLDELQRLLSADAPKGKDLQGDGADEQERARRILRRAWVAQQIGQLGHRSPRAVKLLEELVAHRGVHQDWAYSGLDAATAARALGTLGATESVPLLVRIFLATDSHGETVKPSASRAFTSAAYRLKREIVCVLGELPCDESKRFLRDYLADQTTASRLGGPLFEEATRAFLRQQVAAEELQDLLRSTNSAVRGATILVCLDDPTANRTLLLGKLMPWTQELPHAVK